MVLLVHVAEILYADGERVAFIFDERQKGRGGIEAIRQKLKSRFSQRLARRMGPMESNSSREILPLQTSDLLAYWTYLQRQQELSRSSRADDRLLSMLSPVVTQKLLIRRLLTWEPGVLLEHTETTDPRWDIAEPLPDFSLNYFEKIGMPLGMPEESRRRISDSAWSWLRRNVPKRRPHD